MDEGLGSREIFAKNFKRLLEQKGVTMKQLSADLDIAYNTVVNWSQQKAYPRIDRIDLLAEYFNCEKSDLTEEPENSRRGLIDKLFRNQPELKRLFEETRGMSEDDIRMATQIIRTIKVERSRRNKEDSYGRSVLSEREEV